MNDPPRVDQSLPTSFTPPGVGLVVLRQRPLQERRAHLRCPACDHPMFYTLPRSGDVWLKCQRDKCEAQWWVIILAPGATTRDLGKIVESAAGARALVRRAKPEHGQTPKHLVDALTLTSGETGAYVFIRVTPRLRDEHAFAAGEDVLRALGIL